MAVRRWDARFEEEHLVLRRWRLLPWPRAYVRRIPLAEILDIGSFTATEQAKRHAQLSVQDPSAPDLSEVIPVGFTAGAVDLRRLVHGGMASGETTSRSDQTAATPSESTGGPGGPVRPGGGRCGPGAATGAAGGYPTRSPCVQAGLDHAEHHAGYQPARHAEHPPAHQAERHAERPVDNVGDATRRWAGGWCGCGWRMGRSTDPSSRPATPGRAI